MAHPAPPARPRTGGITLDRRMTLLERAARAGRPVRITYHGDSACAGVAGTDRVIEIHDVRDSQAGDRSYRAWCRQCGQTETFRVDRITKHLTLRGRYQGPTPAISPFFTALGHVPNRQRVRPFTPQHTSTPELLDNSRERIADVENFRAVFGDPEAYPVWNMAHPAKGRKFVNRKPTPAWRKPKTVEGILRQVRDQIRTAEKFRAIVAELDVTVPEAVTT